MFDFLASRGGDGKFFMSWDRDVEFNYGGGGPEKNFGAPFFLGVSVFFQQCWILSRFAPISTRCLAAVCVLDRVTKQY